MVSKVASLLLLVAGAIANQPDAVARMEEAMAASREHANQAISNPRAVARAAVPRTAVAQAAPFLRKVVEASPDLDVPHSFSRAAPMAEKIMDGQYLPNEKGLDADLMSSANEELAHLKAMKTADASKTAHAKTALTAHKSTIQESTSQRAARYFALHGMDKVGRLLGEQLSASEKSKLQQEAQTAKQDISDKELVLDSESDFPNKWKAVDSLRHRKRELGLSN